MTTHYLAIDLGAESGRVMLGSLTNDNLQLEEIYRFTNTPFSIFGTIRWDLLHLYAEILVGLRKASDRGIPISGISTDAWGLDYVLIRQNEPMLSLSYHYRDLRTDGMMESVFKKISAQDIFEETGIQFMPINTLFQMAEDVKTRPEVLECAEQFLNIGDYFNYLLSGIAKSEMSLVSTTQLFNVRLKSWSTKLIEQLGIPKHLFGPIVPSATVLGSVLPTLGVGTNLKDAKVIASCSHDTAAAVAATPGQGEAWAFLSSGTWSLLGTELKEPVINAASYASNFTNELGYADRVLFRKNIVGLWILQECRRAWLESKIEISYSELTELAKDAPSLVSLIQPEDARFGIPGSMPDKITAYCQETSQPIPSNPGAVARCIFESLALLYSKVLHKCSRITETEFSTLHIVGGGSRNSLLNQLTANAIQLPVCAGPAEATAIGNLLIQAKSLGHLQGSLRDVVLHSFPAQQFFPQNSETWQKAYVRFEQLVFKV